MAADSTGRRPARRPSHGRSTSTPHQAAESQPREWYRSGEVSQLLGLSRRQLLYWAQTGLIRPSRATRGGHHRYGFEDLVALKAAKRLLDAGVSLQAIRSSIEGLQRILPDVRRPLAELVLVATGDVVLVIHRGTAFEAVSGQEWVFDVAEFQRELAAWGRSERRAKARRTGRLSEARAS